MDVVADEAGAGSEEPQASLIPQGSTGGGNILFMEEEFVELAGFGVRCSGPGPERLNADFIPCCGEGMLDGFGAGAEAGAGEERPNKSSENEADGGTGLALVDTAEGGKLENPKSPSPLELTEAVRG